ncbi:unnamed protein product [Effrenium voratum]|uniref:Metallo-beta-lactamase domain-containing protein n=1 Tax=Effrenium voratum TaxID=2562239 RepID=A0AA36NAH2_9DINO|nr:unnamed protein product [Effrenium voratum]CAJ1452393.1 unnamed protein product [Effrenium voratum]
MLRFLLLLGHAQGAAVLDCGGVHVHQLQLGQMANYQYIIDNGEVALTVDAAWDVPRIQRYLEKKELRLVGALYTHGHYDHLGGSVPGAGGVPIQGAKELEAAGQPLYLGSRDIEAATAQTGLKASKWHPLREGDTVSLLPDHPILVMDTPGHTLGGVTFWLRGSLQGDCAEGLLFTGDTLFLKNVGRTDLPGGDGEALQRSLARLGRLPDQVQVLPGHSYDAPPRRLDMASVRTGNGAMKAALARHPPASPRADAEL